MANRCSERRPRARFFAAAAVAAVLAGLPLHSLALQEQPDADATARRAAERIRALQREADALVAEETTILAELRKLEAERQARVAELASIEQKRKETEKQLADARQRAATLRETAEAERPEVEARLVQLYKLGRAGYWRLMLDVDDLRSLGRAYRTAAALTHLDRARVEAHQRTLQALDKEQTTLEARAKELAALQEKAGRARAAADRAVATRTALIASIDQRRDLAAQLIGELQSIQQRLQASVNKLSSSPSVTLPLRAFQGVLPWPARGRITSRFGRQTTSRFGTEIVRNGMEIGIAEGQVVRAVHEGTVAFADQFTGYGNLVIIDHGERNFSLYGYLDSLRVARGQRVEAQGPVGTSGLNPSGNPSLYFELRVDGKPVDPLQWLQKGNP